MCVSNDPASPAGFEVGTGEVKPPHAEVTLDTETLLLSVCNAVTGCLPWLTVPEGSSAISG